VIVRDTRGRRGYACGPPTHLPSPRTRPAAHARNAGRVLGPFLSMWPINWRCPWTRRLPAPSASSPKTREALAQYIVRPPVSLQHLLLDERGTDTVIYRAPYSDYFRTDMKLFPALQHLPDSRNRLIRTYGLYSSRARGTWTRSPHLLRLAPEGGKRDHPPRPSVRIGPPEEPKPELSVSAKQSRAAWARLIKKVYETDPLTCSRCLKPMKVLAVITDPAQVLKILRHLIRKGTPPPACAH
jgi:hypothetical protein